MAQPAGKPTKTDCAVIAVLLLLSVAGLLWTAFGLTRGRASHAEIYVDGKLYATYDLNALSNGEIIDVQTDYGYNRFQIKNHGIRCIDTDCPDRLEQKAGVLTRVNQVLVCLPHRLMVKLTGRSTVDAISY